MELKDVLGLIGDLASLYKQNIASVIDQSKDFITDLISKLKDSTDKEIQETIIYVTKRIQECFHN